MSVRDRLAAAVATVLAIGVGAVLLVGLVRVATWGGPDGDTVDASDLPFGLLFLFVAGALVLVGMVGKVVFELLRGR